VTVVTGVIAYIITLFVPTIIDLLIVAYLFLLAGGLVPFLGGLFWKRGTEQGAWWSAIVGLSFILLNTVHVISVPNIHIWGILPSLIVYIIISLITNDKKDKNVVKSASSM